MNRHCVREYIIAILLRGIIIIIMNSGFNESEFQEQKTSTMRDEKRICTDTCTQIQKSKGRNTYLYVRFACEADNHKEQDGNDVVVEAGPVVDFEGRHKGTHQHKKDRAGSQDCTTYLN